MAQNNRVQGQRRRPILTWVRRILNWVRTHPTATITMAAVGVPLIAAAVVLYSLEQQKQQPVYFEEREVLVAGMEDQVERVIDEISARPDTRLGDASLTISRTLRLDFVQQLREDCTPRLRLAKGEGAYVIKLFTIVGQVPRQENRRGPEQAFVESIRGRAQALGLEVFTERNYRTGRPASSLEGNPWSVGGGPWSVGGGAFEGDVVDAANQAFQKQWAFKAIGLSSDMLEDPDAGRGVRVGVFDTSPFPPNVSTVVISMTPPLTLTLLHPFTEPLLDPDAGQPNADDHGLFVAGLVHGVASGSDIQLIRVLDDAADGDVFTLNAALNDFLAQVQADRDELEGVVINLSLVIKHPPDEPIQPEDVDSLQFILEAAAECMDVVVVAATGNESFDSGTGLPAERPAAWASTIGVAASNTERERSCFSNCGEVAAPGGEGTPEPLGTSPCVPAIDKCIAAESTPVPDREECPYAVISLALSSPSGYAYWAGTSFSTPLVSGLAARAIHEEGGWITKDAVLGELNYVAMTGSCVELGAVSVPTSVP